MTLLSGTNAIRIQWAGQSGVTYEAHHAEPDLADTGLLWSAWGGYVTSAPFEQTDFHTTSRIKSYRVIAPFAPPPP